MRILVLNYEYPPLGGGAAVATAALAQGLMERGELVPDSLVLKIVAERIERPDCSHGFVFDGFPRTVAQAQWLGLGRAVHFFEFFRQSDDRHILEA